ncbi:MAG TPA: RsmD family RNA methyltransferase [Herpetosiphonaceae bacterium]
MFKALKHTPRLESWPCPHFPECGGCAMQDIAYTDQLAAKHAALLEIWGEALPAALRDDYTIVAAPDPFGYRLRMDYVCSDDRFGLRVRKRFYAIVDLGECHLIPPSLFAIIRGVYTAARECGLPDYNVYHNTGFLRYLVVRRNVRDEWLLSFVTSERAYEDQMDRAAQAALDAGATSVWWLLNPRHADLSFGDPVKHWGAEFLPQYVLDRTLLMGPNTFFQNNVGGFEQILRYITPFVAGAERMIDLYAGVGTIGIALADQVGKVFAAELSDESVALAQRNIHLNGLEDRVEVVQADVAEILRDTRISQGGAGDVLVVDPPRAGLGPDVCAQLSEHGPQRIVYVSCNAITQAMDYEILRQSYDLVAARGFDLFPQTYHCEQVVVLDRRG